MVIFSGMEVDLSLIRNKNIKNGEVVVRDHPKRRRRWRRGGGCAVISVLMGWSHGPLFCWGGRATTSDLKEWPCGHLCPLGWLRGHYYLVEVAAQLLLFGWGGCTTTLFWLRLCGCFDFWCVSCFEKCIVLLNVYRKCIFCFWKLKTVFEKFNKHSQQMNWHCQYCV